MNPIRFIFAITFSITGAMPAITLDAVLNETLEKNPAIQQAKSNLEQAAGHRLVLRSITWPNLRAAVPAGIQGGHQAGSDSIKGFIFARGFFTTPLVNAAIPPSRRLGDVEFLIAEQQLNVAIVEQLHAVRLAFYSALFNRRLETIDREEQQRAEQNAASQKDRYEAGLTDRSAFTSATVQAGELSSQIEAARRAYAEAQVQLAAATGEQIPADGTMPEPEGELQSQPLDVDLAKETTDAIERRADIRLARLMVRAANDQQRIIEAGYYPLALGTLQGDFIPTTGIHRQGSSRRSDDFTGSEAREGAVYTWRVIDNGKVTGAVITQRETRQINEMACRRLEANVGAELVQIRNNLNALKARQKSLGGGLEMAEQNATSIQQNLAQGLVSQLDYRQAQNASLDVKSGLLTASFQYSVALAEWDRATGRYFQFSEDTTPNVR
ncbi:MAG TPA: TolC family protein [Chthoniobacterales bacterium]|nr:TolC family protein [Chthoniobacterales bacterium]